MGGVEGVRGEGVRGEGVRGDIEVDMPVIPARKYSAR